MPVLHLAIQVATNQPLSFLFKIVEMMKKNNLYYFIDHTFYLYSCTLAASMHSASL